MIQTSTPRISGMLIYDHVPIVSRGLENRLEIVD